MCIIQVWNLDCIPCNEITSICAVALYCRDHPLQELDEQYLYHPNGSQVDIQVLIAVFHYAGEITFQVIVKWMRSV